MNSHFQFFLASLVAFSLAFASCTKESYETTNRLDLPPSIDTVVVENPISLRIANESATVLNGEARWGSNSANNSELYVLTSESVTVECPGGMSTAYDGGETYFDIQFIVTPTASSVFLARLRTEINGVRRDLDNLVPSACAGAPIDIEYEIVNGRISGTLSGEFFYINPIYTDPFSDCANFVSVGIVDVSFDLPLVDKCFEN